MSKLKRARRRSLFRELMSGVSAMREHREGRITLRTHRVDPATLPAGALASAGGPIRSDLF